MKFFLVVEEAPEGIFFIGGPVQDGEDLVWTQIFSSKEDAAKTCEAYAEDTSLNKVYVKEIEL